jgi:3-oxoadipate enol-lactonase
MLRNETERRMEAVEKPERDVRARSGSLYIQDAGEGEPIVLVHDFPLNSRMWEPQIEALFGRYRLIAPDLTGFGFSPAPASELSMADYAKAVLDTINKLGIDHMTVVGACVGGYVALHLVEELGARLQALLLVSTDMGFDSAEAAHWRHELAAETELAGVEVVADEFLPKMLGNSTQRDHPEILDLLRPMVRENTASGVAAMLRALAGRPSGILRRIHCPVVCVVGEEDNLIPPGERYLLSERIPGALTHAISEVGHLVNLERPEAFNDLLMQFMTEFASA